MFGNEQGRWEWLNIKSVIYIYNIYMFYTCFSWHKQEQTTGVPYLRTVYELVPWPDSLAFLDTLAGIILITVS